MMNSQDDLLTHLKHSFEKKDFASYHQLLLSNKSKFDQGIFSYNLGVYYFLQDKYALSRFHFLKAKKFLFHYKDLDQQLELVENQLNLNHISRETLSQKILYQIIELPASYYQAAFGLLSSLAIIWLWRRYKKYKVVFISLGSLYLCLFFLYKGAINFRPCIIFEKTLVREGPSQIFPIVNKISLGQKAMVIKDTKGWIKIYIPFSYSGWIKRDKAGIY